MVLIFCLLCDIDRFQATFFFSHDIELILPPKGIKMKPRDVELFPDANIGDRFISVERIMIPAYKRHIYISSVCPIQLKDIYNAIISPEKKKIVLYFFVPYTNIDIFYYCTITK